MTSATSQHPLASEHTASGALSSRAAPATSPACDIPSGGLFPTDIERVYLNYRARWERHYLSAVRRRNTRDMKEAQDHIDNATRHLAMCARDASKARLKVGA